MQVFSVISVNGTPSPSSPSGTFTYSNSYTSTQYSQNYHDSRGHTVWSGFSLVQQQTGLVRATHHVDARYGHIYRGRRLLYDQSLEWSRVDAYDNSKFIYIGVPECLQKAVSEYALRACVYGELAPDPIANVNTQDFSQTNQPSNKEFDGGIAIRTLDKIGPLETERFYGNPAQLRFQGSNKYKPNPLVTDSFVPEYPPADQYMMQLINVGNQRLIRGS